MSSARDSATDRLHRSDEKSEDPTNHRGGKTDFDHRERSSRRMDEESNDQSDEGPNHACNCRSK